MNKNLKIPLYKIYTDYENLQIVKTIKKMIIFGILNKKLETLRIITQKSKRKKLVYKIN